MGDPIKQGDLCEVIGGKLGRESPNLGLVVRVKSFRGEHSVYGRIWRCEAEYAVRAQEGKDVPPGDADFAQDWLRKIEPPGSTKTTQVEKLKELEL